MPAESPSSSSSPLNPRLQRWQARGRLLKLSGMEVFVVDEGPRNASETLLLLHGFPSSAYDWRLLLPTLSAQRRVILFDFPGYGLSSKPTDHAYSLFEQADVVEELMLALQLKAVQLIAHDMGTTVACELLARRERGLLCFDIQSLVLLNGSVHIELAQLTPSQKLLRSPLAGIFSRLSSRTTFNWQLQRIVGKPLAEEELLDMWELIQYGGGREVLPLTIGYINERWRFGRRWIGALTRLDLPTLVLWGRQDTVAVPAIAEQLEKEIPGVRVHWLEPLGHYLQLEDPGAVSAVLAGFLAEQTVAREQRGR